MATFSWPGSAGGGSGSNASVGTNSGTAPTSSTEIGGINPGGNLQPLQTDNSGNLLVSLAAEPGAPFHVIVDSSALPTGASTSALQTTGNTSVASIDTKTPALGQAVMASSSPVVIASNQSAVPISAASLPLPTGAATAAKQPALGTAGAASTDVITVQGIASGVAQPVSGTFFQTTQPVSIATAPALVASSAIIGKVGIDQTTPGTTNLVALAANQSVNTAQINGVTPLMGNGVTGTGSLRVTLASDTSSNTNPLLVAEVVATTSAITSVAGSGTTVSLLASNASRKGATFFNESAATLYLKLGATASVTSYTVQVPPNGYYEMPFIKSYTGAIDGIWSSAAGNVRITELT